nr:hypothetical protein [Tanacetum cinerariifolium]
YPKEQSYKCTYGPLEYVYKYIIGKWYSHRPVSDALPNISVTRPRHAHQVVIKFKSSIRRHITRSPSSRTSNSPPRVTVVEAPVVSAAQGKQGTWV